VCADMPLNKINQSRIHVRCFDANNFMWQSIAALKDIISDTCKFIVLGNVGYA